MTRTNLEVEAVENKSGDFEGKAGSRDLHAKFQISVLTSFLLPPLPCPQEADS